MQLVHTNSDGESDVIATDIENADSPASQAVGLMFRRTIPEDYALLMDFSKMKYRGIHSVFVLKPIDVVWLEGETVVQVKRLRPFLGAGIAASDRVIELPAGAAAADIEPGDTIVHEDD